jgi:hypothetical protein
MSTGELEIKRVLCISCENMVVFFVLAWPYDHIGILITQHRMDRVVLSHPISNVKGYWTLDFRKNTSVLDNA